MLCDSQAGIPGGRVSEFISGQLFSLFYLACRNSTCRRLSPLVRNRRRGRCHPLQALTVSILFADARALGGVERTGLISNRCVGSSSMVLRETGLVSGFADKVAVHMGRDPDFWVCQARLGMEEIDPSSGGPGLGKPGPPELSTPPISVRFASIRPMRQQLFVKIPLPTSRYLSWSKWGDLAGFNGLADPESVECRDRELGSSQAGLLQGIPLAREVC